VIAEGAGLRGDVSGTVVVSIEAPRVAPERLLAIEPDEDAALWAPPAGLAFAGVGSVLELSAEGPERFSRIREQAVRALAGVRTAMPAGALEPPAPRLLGGFSFQSGRALRAPWSAFGEARFVLPRITYAVSEHGAHLCLALRADEVGRRDEHARWLARLERIAAELAEAAPSAAPVVRGARLEEAPDAEFVQRVGAILEGIEAGRFEKVVAARRSLLAVQGSVDPAAVLSALGAQAVGCTRFAFRRGRTTFVGATPERLVEKRALDVETDALAGSIRADRVSAAGLLLDSAKDRAEHELVVRELVSALTPLAASLSYPTRPEVRRLRHLLHLRTPIVARLHNPCHVLELVARLHPTPAVGGVPTEAALSWIKEHEPDERGWYAGPVGWLDADGDGSFAVALRSGVLEPGRVHLYAGAGIVRGSHAESELAETRLKLASLLAALGVEP
jgi:menaquinone-specific isochorismate synthase